MIPLLDDVCARLPPEAAAWLRTAEDESGAGKRDRFLAGFAAAGRKLGHGPLDAGPWTLAQAGRARLLAAFAHGLANPERRALVLDLFEQGELSEQQAILRALPWLPGAQDYVAVAELAIRQNALSVLEAIVCDNPFPAAQLGDAMWNQMVMKALFNTLPLARVVGLGARATPELRRMVTAWASERRAAGRPVPADVDLIVQEDAHAAV